MFFFWIFHTGNQISSTGLCYVTETKLQVFAFSHRYNRYISGFQTQRALFHCLLVTLCPVCPGPYVVSHLTAAVTLFL